MTLSPNLKHLPAARGRSQRILAVLLVLACALSYAADRKPNFLFIVTDDQRWDALGVVQKEMGERGRYPWIKTPNMDRIANEGVRFRNGFVTLSLCAPSRAAFMTGQYNHLNGVANNHTPFTAEANGYPQLLSDAGYATAYIGKWHMGNQRGKRPGFTYSASFIGQGKYWNCPFEVNGVQTPTQGWVDDISTSYAIQFITDNKDKPFSVTIGFKSCHGPNEPPPRTAKLYEGEEARAVPNLDVRAIYRGDEPTSGPGQRRRARTDAQGAHVNLNYYRTIAAADEDIGLILKTLDDLKLADDTVVVFAGDNGYYQGEHGLSDKRSMYDESLRIPLLVRYPKLFPKGKAMDDMVLNIDMAPTFLELAGVAAPKTMQGRSWVSLLTGKSKDWRTAFLAEYFEENNFPATPTMVGVRTMDAKLITYPGHDDWTELFDLKKDPYETKNLVKDPAAGELLAKMQKVFKEQQAATKFAVPSYVDKPSTGTAAANVPVNAKD